MWQLADKTFTRRLLIGSAQYPSLDLMHKSISASEAEIVTVSLRRQMGPVGDGNDFWQSLRSLNLTLLPNTAGCHNAKEAITTALMAREVFDTHWIKLEVIGDEHSLQPDPFALVEACAELIQQGFEVFPYCTDDIVLCEKLVSLGCRILMPWAAPIGSGKGLLNPYALSQLRFRFPQIQLIIDAGIGKPSHAAQAMELGYDGVLLNSAVAKALDPVRMAQAFNYAVRAGRDGYIAGLMPEQSTAQASTPDLGRPFWHS